MTWALAALAYALVSWIVTADALSVTSGMPALEDRRTRTLLCCMAGAMWPVIVVGFLFKITVGRRWGQGG